MMMQSKTVEDLITDMADNLSPVRRRSPMQCVLVALLLWVICTVFYLWHYGLRPDFAALQPSSLSLLSFLLAMNLCVVTLWSVAQMALPGVGRNSNGWYAAALIVPVVPVTGLLVALGDPVGAEHITNVTAGIPCLLQGLIVGLGAAAGLTWWMRGGAPMSASRTGVAVGLASGTAGVAMVALHCPIDDIVHIGIWHAMVVLIMLGAGWLLLPRLMRW